MGEGHFGSEQSELVFSDLWGTPAEFTKMDSVMTPSTRVVGIGQN